MSALPGTFWTSRSLVIQLDDGRRTTTRNLGQPFAVVGSAANATVCIRDPRVARRRFYLHATDEGVFCVDLAPPAGIPHAVGWWLEPDQWLEIGAAKIAVRLDGGPLADVERPNLTERGSIGSERPAIRVAREGRSMVNRLVSRRLTLIGRKSPCSFRIESYSVSGVHCALYWDQGRMWVIDLLSTAGTLWQGRPHEVVPLPFGESVQIGNYGLHLVAPHEINGDLLDVVAVPGGSDAKTGRSDPALGHSLQLEGGPGGSVDLEPPSNGDGATADARAEYERWKREADELVATRQKWAEETARLTASRARLEAEWAESLSTRQQWESETASLAAERQIVERERVELETLRRQCEAERASVAEQRRQLETELAESAAVRRRAAAEATEMAAARQALQAETAEVLAARQQWEAENSRLLSTRERLESEIRNSLAARKNWESQSPQMAAAREKLEQEIREAATARAKWDVESEQLAAARRQLDEELAQSAESRDKWKAEVAQLAVTREQLEQQTAAAEAARLRWEKETQQLDAARAELDTALADARSQQQKLETESAQLETRQQRLERETQELTTTRDKWEREAAELAAQRESLVQRELAIEEQEALLARHDERHDDALDEQHADWSADRVATDESPGRIVRRFDAPLPVPSLANEGTALLAPASPAGTNGSLALSISPAAEPCPALVDVPLKPDNEAEPVVSIRMIRENRGLVSEPEDVVAIPVANVRPPRANHRSEIVPDGTMFDEQAERMTAQLVRMTTSQRRRRLVFMVLGFVLLAGIAAGTVAWVWMHREQWLVK